MATTAQQLINRSMELCGKLGAGRTPGVSESAQVFLYLNTLVDQFNTERCYVCGVDQVAVTITSGTRSYALATRPIHIERAEFLITAGGITNWPVPVEVMGADKFSAIPAQGVTSPFPVGLWCDYGITTATIYIAPVPAAGALKLYTWQVLAAFATLGDTVTVPPGILRALQYALAVELCSVFGLPLTPALIASAAGAKAAMETLNVNHVGTQVPK